MKVVIDSNSLIYLARYYLPFDKKGVLLNFFKRQLMKGSLTGAVTSQRVTEVCKGKLK